MIPPDPFALKRNVARSLNSQMVFEYIQERFRTAYKYFACPQSRNGTNGSRGYLRKKSRRRARARKHGHDGTAEPTSGELKNVGEEEDEESSDDEDDEEEILSADFGKLLASDVQMDAGLLDEAVSQELSSPVMSSLTPNGLLMDSDEEEVEKEKHRRVEQENIAPEDMHYIFDRMIFTGGKVTCCQNDVGYLFFVVLHIQVFGDLV